MNNLTEMKYTGHVFMKLKIGDHVYKIDGRNSGTPEFMRSFAKFLSGNSISVIDTPQFLDIRKLNTSTSLYVSVLSQVVNITGREFYFDEEYDNWVCKYKATVSYSHLTNPITSGSGTYRFYLYSGTNSEQTEAVDFAYLPVDSQSLSRIVPGTQALIEWVVQVSN